MIYLAIIIVSILFICSLLFHFIVTKPSVASKLAKVLTIFTLLGFILCFGSYIIFYVNISNLDNAELSAAAGDAFYVYATPSSFFAALTIVLTVAIHFLSGKLQAVRIAVSHLASLLILLYTLICASWSHYDEINIALYVAMLGIALALACLISPALQMRALAKKLTDEEFVKARLLRLGKNKTYAMERRRIKETKKRIKKGTKK